MVKIFISVRNRLAITKKCIRAIQKHSELDNQIYVYDNETNYRVNEHFEYFRKLYQKRQIAQVSFTTEAATFRAFSKASTCNFFGLQHEQDPKKDKYDFLVMIDNDIIVCPGWDAKLKMAWNFVKENKMNNIKVIGQRPGGIKNLTKENFYIGKEKMVGRIGMLGGSGLWSVQPDFFRDVGFLNLKNLVGHDKKHDQLYWQLLSKATKGQRYIMGLEEKLGVHCGKYAGSVCNRLTRFSGDKNKASKILFEEQEKAVDSVDFNTFYKSILDDTRLLRDW